MKKLFFISIIILIFTSNSYAFLGFGEKDHEEAMSVIVEETKEAAQEIKEMTIEEVLEKSNYYEERTRELKESLSEDTKWILMDKTKKDKNDAIVEYYGDITSFYGGIAKNRDELLEDFKNEINEIKRWSEAISKKKEQEKQYLNQLQSKLNNVEHISNKSNRNIRRKTLSGRIKTTKMRIDMLKSFSKYYDNSFIKFNNLLDDVEGVLYAYVQAYKFFKDSYKTLKMKKDLAKARKKLDSKISFANNISNIRTTMQDAMKIVKMIVNESKDYPEKENS